VQTWQLAQQQQQAKIQQADYAAARIRQMRLAQAAQQASAQAVTYNASLTPAQREARVTVRIAAQKQLFAQGQAALQSKNAGASVTLLMGAAALAPPAGTVASAQGPSEAAIAQALAQARQDVRQAEQLRAAQFTAAREAALRTQRDQQLQQARQQIAQDQKAYKASLNALGTSQAERDEKAYRDLKSQGINLLSQKKYEAALTAFHGAQRSKPTDEIRQFIRNAEFNAITDGKSPQEKAAIEQKLQAEANRRKEIDEAARQKDNLYKTALQAAHDALAQKNYDAAQAKFQERIAAG
jgi:hypothetical protein